VPCGDDRYFAAPNLIIHYIEAHGYAPPDEFLLAVQAMTDTDLQVDYDAVYDRLVRAAYEV
jgi:hypothetical protein